MKSPDRNKQFILNIPRMMAPYEPSYQDLHCLQKHIFGLRAEGLINNGLNNNSNYNRKKDMTS